MSLFAKAAEAKSAKVAAAPASKKKSTTWLVGSSKDSEAVANSVSELVELKAQQKAIDARMTVHKTLVLNHARESFYQTYAANGVLPDTPMCVQNGEGHKVTFVVQDRSASGQCKPEQLDALGQVLGMDAARDLVAEEVRFSFQRMAMLNPKIQEVLGRHLEAAIDELTQAGLVESFEDVLDVQTRMAFKPGVLQNLAISCGSDTRKMRSVVEAMGSNVTQYVKV